MTTTELINNINKAKSYIDIFTDLTNWNNDYKNFVKKIHPDVCKELGAANAVSKLNSFKEELEKGKSHIDDAGTITYNINKCIIEGDTNVLKYSLDNYSKLMNFKEKIDLDFQRYIPKSILLKSNSSLEINLGLRSLPLSAVEILPLEHVLWILSRMLEFTAYMHKRNFVHAGINPDSVYIEPINHGVNIISFYHTTELNKKLATASGKYLYFYPEHIRTNKIATGDIDIELCKRTAIYLLGDKSGIGTSLRKTISIPFLDFINTRHTDPIQTFLDYREMLKKNFERKFIKLSI